jgi:threonine aldolase
MKSDDLVLKLKKEGIVSTGFGKQTIRFVTHLDFTDAMLDKTIRVLKQI